VKGIVDRVRLETKGEMQIMRIENAVNRIEKRINDSDRAVRIAVLEEVGCSYIEHGYAKDCSDTISKNRVCRRCAKLRELKGGK